MVDSVTPELRSAIMRRVRSKDTRPEMLVRRLVFSMGFRYRLHYRTLPGSPDLVFPSRRKVIFVHGCFWHLHENCKLARMPKSRLDFWERKLGMNKERDARKLAELSQLGWKYLVIWECELHAPDLESRIKEFLG